MPRGYPDWHRGVKADIIAQTIDKIKIDIIAQTLEKIGVDILAQTISEIIQYPKVGKCYAEFGYWAGDADEEFTVVDVLGRGHLIFYLVFIYARVGSEATSWNIVLDGKSLTGDKTYFAFNMLGFDVNTFPIKLLKFATDGECSIAFVPSVPISFDVSLRLTITVTPQGYSDGWYMYAYTLL